MTFRNESEAAAWVAFAAVAKTGFFPEKSAQDADAMLAEYRLRQPEPAEQGFDLEEIARNAYMKNTYKGILAILREVGIPERKV